MKILEKKEISPVRVRCPICDSLLEVTPEDVKDLRRKPYYDSRYPGHNPQLVPGSRPIGSVLLGDISCLNCKQEFSIKIRDEAFAAQVRICLQKK